MKIYKSVKNGTLAKLIDLNDRGVTFEMEDGSQKEFSMSTFKRWWKFDSETPDEIEKASEEQGEPENEVVENEPQEDAPVDNNVDSVDNPPAEKEAPVKEAGIKGWQANRRCGGIVRLYRRGSKECRACFHAERLWLYS